MKIIEVIVSCFVNQVEMHPYFPQQRLVEFCRNRDIVITAYSPFGCPQHPEAKPGDPKLLEEPVLLELAKKYGKGPNHIILRWLVMPNYLEKIVKGILLLSFLFKK